MIICLNQYNDPKSQLYGRYIHDCIIGPSSTREEINQFITAVNSLHSSLKYTYIHTYFICNSQKELFSYKRNKKDKTTINQNE